MLLRQQFVVQLGITEVQWNQRLLVFDYLCWAGDRPDFQCFCGQKAISPRPSMSTTGPAK